MKSGIVQQFPGAPCWGVPSRSEEISYSNLVNGLNGYGKYFTSEDVAADFIRIFGEKYVLPIIDNVIPYGKNILGEEPKIIGVSSISEGFGSIRLGTPNGRETRITTNVNEYVNPDSIPIRFRQDKNNGNK